MCQAYLHAPCVHITECIEPGMACIPVTDAIQDQVSGRR